MMKMPFREEIKELRQGRVGRVMWRIQTENEAQKALDYFNGFHDGFIHQLCLRSRDSFSQEGPDVTDIVHNLTGNFEATINISHYNYGQGTQPYDRLVQCVFDEVREFHLDLRQSRSYEWPIKNVEIRPTERSVESGDKENCLALVFLWGNLVNNQWGVHQEQILTFKKGEFTERNLM